MLTKYARILSRETDYIGGPLEGSSQQISKALIFIYVCRNHLLCFLNQSSIGFLMTKYFNIHLNFSTRISLRIITVTLLQKATQ